MIYLHMIQNSHKSLCMLYWSWSSWKLEFFSDLRMAVISPSLVSTGLCAESSWLNYYIPYPNLAFILWFHVESSSRSLHLSIGVKYLHGCRPCYDHNCQRMIWFSRVTISRTIHLENRILVRSVFWNRRETAQGGNRVRRQLWWKYQSLQIGVRLLRAYLQCGIVRQNLRRKIRESFQVGYRSERNLD